MRVVCVCLAGVGAGQTAAAGGLGARAGKAARTSGAPEKAMTSPKVLAPPALDDDGAAGAAGEAAMTLPLSIAAVHCVRGAGERCG